MMGLVCSYWYVIAMGGWSGVSTVMEPEWVLAGVNVVL